MQASTTCRCAAPSSTKQGAISARIVGVVDRLAAQLGFGERGEPRRADQRDVAAWPKSRISAWVYSRVTVASVPSTDTRFVCEAAQAGLIAGTVPTKGTVKRSRSSGSTSVEAVLQAITTRSGACASISSPISAITRATSASSRNRAVGKQRVVRRIDEPRIGPRARDLAEHGQAADAGIEHQDARVNA